jgi:peptidoglycan/xylan/chitin deacetylase (PgdA/CDA1 family)
MHWLKCLLVFSVLVSTCKPKERPDKLVVLTFDDAVKTHYSFVAPLLEELGFGATFFVSARWMEDSLNFMSWDEIGQLHRMGFEIGNHSWSHLDYSLPENVARLEGELGLVDLHLKWQDVPKPTSFAYCGNWFGPETVDLLQSLGYRFARRGMQPEVNYGEIEPGPLYDPFIHHPLLIPSAGDAYPEWDFDHFKKVVDRAGSGKIAVLQFHGVPDVAHPWVTTEPELFKQCMEYLKQEGFEVVALRDIEKRLPEILPHDSIQQYTHSSQKQPQVKLPTEVEATRKSVAYWYQNMFIDHAFTVEEAQQVTQLSLDTLKTIRQQLIDVHESQPISSANHDKLKIRAYPGGRHPRIGFLDGAMDPQRGTKFSVFLPDQPSQYVVIDLPEAIFSNLGLTYLAHRHFPTIWDYRHIFIDNTDWQVNTDGSLENVWTLPNGISFGAKARPGSDQVDMELWLFNGTDAHLDSLKTQVCVMLKGADHYNDLTNDNKQFSSNTVAVKSNQSNRWILTSWERTFNPWGNPPVPCMHTDPMFEACAPGDTVRLQGKIWFYAGNEIGQFLN